MQGALRWRASRSDRTGSGGPGTATRPARVRTSFRPQGRRTEMARHRHDRDPDRQLRRSRPLAHDGRRMAEQWFDGKVVSGRQRERSTTRCWARTYSPAGAPCRSLTSNTATCRPGSRNWSARGLSAGHVRKIHGVLSGILGLAVRDRRLPSNPALGVDLPRMRERPRRYLTAAQVEQLAAAAGDGRLAVLVLAYCGLRWSELAALRVGRWT